MFIISSLHFLQVAHISLGKPASSQLEKAPGRMGKSSLHLALIDRLDHSENRCIGRWITALLLTRGINVENDGLFAIFPIEVLAYISHSLKVLFSV